MQNKSVFHLYFNKEEVIATGVVRVYGYDGRVYHCTHISKRKELLFDKPWVIYYGAFHDIDIIDGTEGTLPRSKVKSDVVDAIWKAFKEKIWKVRLLQYFIKTKLKPKNEN